jgi:hypothetical protein
MANTVVEEACRQVLFSVEAERYGARRGTQSLRVGESSFMPQRLTLVENAVGSRQR